MTCPICKRPFGNPDLVQFHHLIPKTFKGREGITIHKICHQKIHSVFTERELLHVYHTVETLCEHEEMSKFIKWVSKKDPDFYDKNDDTSTRHRKRNNTK